MFALIKPFLELCLLRLAPQQLPASQLLLGIALTANTLSAWMAAMVHLPFGDALLAGITDSLLL